MTHLDEIKILRKFPRHYLWNKRRSKWTPKDIENFNSLSMETQIVYAKRKNSGQPIIQFKDNEKIEYPNVVIASLKTGISKAAIYNVVNGHAQRAGGYKWEKVLEIINQ